MQPTPSLWQQMVPNIAQTLVSVAGDVVRQQVRAAMTRRPAARPLQQGESPQETPKGCPYCAVTKNLAIAHRYLTRATQRLTQWGMVYQELALIEVRSASQTLLELSPNDLDTLRLANEVNELEVALSAPLETQSQTAHIADRVWIVSDHSIALAERYQAALHNHDVLANQMEQSVDDLAHGATIIEGQATVLS